MKFSFNHRIIGAFLIIAVLLIFVGYFAFVTTNNLQKVSRATMKKYVPKRMWNDIKPIIDRLQVFQEGREKRLSQSDPQ